MDRNYRYYASLAREAAAAAADLVGQAFRVHDREAEQKADGSFVTKTDLASQAIIASVLMAATPDFGFYAEEATAAERTRSDYTWIVDPIDGTHNFHYGVPLFAVQIALEHRGQVVAAAMALPAEDLILDAWRGGGAYANGERLAVSSRAMGEGLLLLETRWSDADLVIARAFKDKTHDLRVIASSCASLAYIALGRADMLVDWDDKPWDLAGGALLVEEAGGVVTDLNGGPFRVYDPKCLASNGVDHAGFVRDVVATNAFTNLPILAA